MDLPDHLQQRPRHGQHRTARWSVRARSPYPRDLPLDRPPVMDSERMVNEDNRVGRRKAGTDQVSIAPAVDDPGRRGEHLIVEACHVLRRRGDPARAPLHMVNAIDGERADTTKPPTQGRLPTPSIPNDGDPPHVVHLCRSLIGPHPALTRSSACSGGAHWCQAKHGITRENGSEPRNLGRVAANVAINRLVTY